MPRRSIRITLQNNTSSTLTLLKKGVCHGEFTDGLEPRLPRIPPKGADVWQTESSGIATGTEGWIKYALEDPGNDPTSGEACVRELIYIHWDNPFIWDGDTKPIDDPSSMVRTSDFSPPCDDDGGEGSTFGFQPGGKSSSRVCRHEVFGATAGGGNRGITWWDVAVNWPFLLGFTIIGDLDINLEVTLGLRQAGSISQTIKTFHDGSKGLRSLSTAAGISSLKTLFHF